MYGFLISSHIESPTHTEKAFGIEDEESPEILNTCIAIGCIERALGIPGIPGILGIPWILGIPGIAEIPILKYNVIYHDCYPIIQCKKTSIIFLYMKMYRYFNHKTYGWFTYGLEA